MKPTAQLHDLGQSLWLDNITRSLLDDGTLARYIAEDSITGLTSNPSIFDAAIGEGKRLRCGHPHEGRSRACPARICSPNLRWKDLRRAADLFRPVFDATSQIDGWVSMEVSPLLAADTAGSIAAAEQIHWQAARDNLFVKIPGTPAGIPAIEEAIFLAFLSMSPCCFLARSTWRLPKPICAASSAASKPDATPRSARSLPCSSAAGTSPPTSSCPLSCTICSVSPSVSRPTGRIANCWIRRAGRNLPPPAHRPQRLLWASTGSKDPSTSTRCTSARLPHPTRSTPCRKRPCTPSPIMASCTE